MLAGSSVAEASWVLCRQWTWSRVGLENTLFAPSFWTAALPPRMVLALAEAAENGALLWNPLPLFPLSFRCPQIGVAIGLACEVL